jgi:calcineurin-like phosphoesterase family protein
VTTYFTSDLHIGHRLVSGLRGFLDYDDVEACERALAEEDKDYLREHAEPDSHDQDLAGYWDGAVSAKHDTVVILGDIASSQFNRALEFIADRPGKKILVSGNHDIVHPMHRRGIGDFEKWSKVFSIITPFERRKTAGISFLTSHFPYEGEGARPGPDRYTQYRLRDEGMPLLHGHTHDREQREHGHSLHVGWDAWQGFVGSDYIAGWLRRLTADG